MKPLAIDLFCGLGGWTEGLLAEGYRVVGFDLEQHVYGEHRYPAQLVLQDVLTIHGLQFKTAALIVASPPCQEYSYMAMPWTKAKQKIRDYEDGTRDVKQLTALFDACFRIQREASDAAGHHIPLVVENVRGAQRWVGRSRWNFGSFHLWGDVPALMPSTRLKTKAPKPGTGNQLVAIRSDQMREDEGVKHAGSRLEQGSPRFARDGVDGVKVSTMGGSWYPPGHPKHVAGLSFNGHAEEGVKGFTPNGGPLGKNELGRKHGSKSRARKAASAMIAKIPTVLARHIASVYYPRD